MVIMKNKKVLYFCSSYPFPIDDGIKKINVNLINEFLKQSYEVTLVVPSDINVEQPDYFKSCEVIEYSKVRTLSKMIRSLCKLQPLYFGLYYDNKLLYSLKKEEYELIFYDFYPLTQYSTGLKQEVFMMPDSMKQLSLSGFKNEKGLVRKTYLYLNYLLCMVYNQKISNLKKLYVSNEDIKIDNIINSHYFKIPADNEMDEKYIHVEYNKKEILFRGIMDFEPNITAVKSFYDEIFIELIKKYPSIKLKIVGKNPSQTLIDSMPTNTIFTGFVDDIFDEMNQSALHIVPMISGTGVKTKMLDSIMLRRLVFATPKALNGIFESSEEARENGIVVYSNKEEFLHYFKLYINGELDYEKMVDLAFNYISQNSYSKKVEELMNFAQS